MNANLRQGMVAGFLAAATIVTTSPASAGSSVTATGSVWSNVINFFHRPAPAARPAARTVHVPVHRQPHVAKQFAPKVEKKTLHPRPHVDTPVVKPAEAPNPVIAPPPQEPPAKPAPVVIPNAAPAPAPVSDASTAYAPDVPRNDEPVWGSRMPKRFMDAADDIIVKRKPHNPEPVISISRDTANAAGGISAAFGLAIIVLLYVKKPAKPVQKGMHGLGKELARRRRPAGFVDPSTVSKRPLDKRPPAPKASGQWPKPRRPDGHTCIRAVPSRVDNK